MHLEARRVRTAIALPDTPARAAPLDAASGNPLIPVTSTDSSNQNQGTSCHHLCRPVRSPNHRPRSPFPRAASRARFVALQLQFGQVDLAEVRQPRSRFLSAQLRASVLTSFTREQQYDALRFRKVIAGEPVIPLPEEFRTSAFGFPHRNRPCIISRACWFSVYSFLKDANVPRRVKKFICPGPPELAAGNPQILEAAADRKNRRLLLVQALLRRNARDDAVRRHHIQNVQTLDRSRLPRSYRVVFGLRLEPTTE